VEERRFQRRVSVLYVSCALALAAEICRNGCRARINVGITLAPNDTLEETTVPNHADSGNFNHEPQPEETRLRSVPSTEYLRQQSPFRRSRLLQHLKSICLQRLRILIVAIACQLPGQLHGNVKD
jgi:hypothetical protein